MRKVLDLARQLEQAPDHAPEALEGFVQGETFPLVEDDTATFFFWDGQPTEAVYLLHWVFGLESRQPFRRLAQTDAFYLPLELPRKGRIEYKLEVIREGGSHFMRDPLNDRQAFDPFGSNSVCPMPGYHPPPWLEAEERVRQGRLERFEIASRVWGDVRATDVYLPAEYKPTKRYPLLICHDGDDYRRFASLGTVLDLLIHRHEVAPLVVAFTNGHDRNPEYGANPRQAAFLVEELLPELQQRFHLHESPTKRGLMGASFGAVSSLHAAWQHPGVFGRLLLQSGSFAFTDIGGHDRGPLWDPVVDFVNALRQDPSRIDAKIFMSCGTFESLIYYNRSLLPLFRDAGLEVRYVEAQDGHNWINWRDRLRDGLAWLYPGHLWMFYE